MKPLIGTVVTVALCAGLSGCVSGAWNLTATVPAQTPAGQPALITADFSATNGYSTTGTLQTGTLEIVIVDSTQAVKYRWTKPFNYSTTAIDIPWTVSWNTTGFATGQYGVTMNVLDNTGTLVASATPASLDIVNSIGALLANYAPGTPHEALPHGVPVGYSWQAQAILNTVTPPLPTSDYIDAWGQVFVDTTDTFAANVRVDVADCQFWTLPTGSNTWTDSIDASGATLGGGAWSEDFTVEDTNSAHFNVRPETDGSTSYIPVQGVAADYLPPPNGPGLPAGENWNSHFWPNVLTRADNLRAAVTVCRTRLILDNPNGPDNRAASHYLLSVGADWRQSNYNCPTVNGQTVCDPVGIGKFIKVTSSWRDAIFSSMSASALQSLPLPPATAFVLPDGTYPTS